MIWPWFLKKFWWAIDGNENWIFVSQNVSTFEKIKSKRKKAAELSVICLIYRVNHTYVVCMQCILCTKCAQMSVINPRLIVLPIYFVRTRFIYSDVYTIFQKNAIQTQIAWDLSINQKTCICWYLVHDVCF